VSSVGGGKAGSGSIRGLRGQAERHDEKILNRYESLANGTQHDSPCNRSTEGEISKTVPDPLGFAHGDSF